MLKNTTLCFDFGNTRLKCGVFIKEQLSEVFAISDDSNETIKELISKYKPVKTILSSVVEHNIEMEKILSEASTFHRLSAQTHLPFTTPVGKPETIGADRLALAAASVYFYKGVNNLVIGLGSCITYNFINKYHSFLGGSISPGMEMRFKSMNDYTAKLPLIRIDPRVTGWNFPLAGYDTRTNLLSGVLYGMAAEIDGIISSYHDKYNNLNVLLTGGDSVYFSQYIKNKLIADPELIFKGLFAISEAN
ncbi:MAG: type III pantothenate kinase [Bacteroidota bacterium]|nr:type III pantothenate kinase [Bacteroidota bacterium]